VCDLVIFDCDGVLIDSDRISLRVQAERLRELGLSLSYEECMRDFLGIGMRATLAIVAERIGRPVPDWWFDGLDAAVRQAFLDGLTAVSGIGDALDAIAMPTCICARPSRSASLPIAASSSRTARPASPARRPPSIRAA